MERNWHKVGENRVLGIKCLSCGIAVARFSPKNWRLTHVTGRINQTRLECTGTRIIQNSGQQCHPLLRYDADALNGGMELLKLEYLTKTTVARYQKSRDSKRSVWNSHRRSILATSHAWFISVIQIEGVKLEIMRKSSFLWRTISSYWDFSIRRLAFLSSVASSYSRREKEIWKCMKHMNSIYCYCDVVLFIDAPLPRLDHTVFSWPVPWTAVVTFHRYDSIRWWRERHNHSKERPSLLE